jgi:hypothetical protein
LRRFLKYTDDSFWRDMLNKVGGRRMRVIFLDSSKLERLRNTMNNDTEFKLAARYMSEDILLEADDSRCRVRVHNGVVTEIRLDPPSEDHWSFSIKATAESWEKLLQSSPPPFYTGLNAGLIRGILQITGNVEVAFAYLWAMNRMLDIMRPLQNK